MPILTHADRLLDTTLRAIGFHPTITLSRDANGILWADDGHDRIAIVTPERAVRYRHGIRRRCRKITDEYLGEGRVAIRHGDWVINAGANVGEVASNLATRGARVVAIEPDPVARACLIANCAGLEVDILNYAVWKEDIPLSFFLATEKADSSAVNPSDRQISVEARTIDSISSGVGVHRLRLIVGDVEGAEPELLMGAFETLKRADYVSLNCGHEREVERTSKAARSSLALPASTLSAGRTPNAAILSENASSPGNLAS